MLPWHHLSQGIWMSPFQREGQYCWKGKVCSKKTPPRSFPAKPPHSIPLLAQIRRPREVFNLGQGVHLKLPEQFLASATRGDTSAQASYLALLTDPTCIQELEIIATRDLAWDESYSASFPRMNRFRRYASTQHGLNVRGFSSQGSLSRTSTQFLVLAPRGSPQLPPAREG